MEIEWFKNLQTYQKHSVGLLLLLCSVNICIVIIALFNTTLQPEIPLLSLDLDGSLAEYFQYIEELFIALILVVLAFSRSDRGLLLWGGLFLYLFIDDAFSVHEATGMRMEGFFSSVTTLELPVHLYEMFFSMAVAACFLLSIIINFFLDKSAHARAVAYDLIFFLGLIGFFGVFVDVLHVALGDVWWMYLMLTVIEEGGELFTFSLILAYVYQMARSKEGEGLLVVQPIADRIYRTYLASCQA